MLPNATPITIAVPPMKAGTMKPVHVIGGGLAGSEAAWQLARAGVPVLLHEMRPEHGTEANRPTAWSNWCVPIRSVPMIPNPTPSAPGAPEGTPGAPHETEAEPGVKKPLSEMT